MTADLSAWLLAQIAAEEERARAAAEQGPAPSGNWWGQGSWWLEGVEMLTVGKGRLGVDVVAYAYADEDRAHIAANDPAATLRRCAAYRAIVEAAVKAFSYDATYDNIVCGEQNAYDVTLRALATIYADADGYDPSWRLG